MYKQKQNIPALFKAIIENQRLQERYKSQESISFVKVKELILEMREYRRAAEIALCWNKDKGNTA